MGWPDEYGRSRVGRQYGVEYAHHMPRPRRTFVALGIAIIALAPLLPGGSALYAALVDPAWVLLPDQVFVGVCSAPADPGEQPLAFYSPLASRAPPAGSLS